MYSMKNVYIHVANINTFNSVSSTFLDDINNQNVKIGEMRSHN